MLAVYSQPTIQAEVQAFINNHFGESIVQWNSDTCFTDKHGCDGNIYESTEAARADVLTGFEHQCAIDYVDGAMTDEDWISYLQHGGIDDAEQIISNHDWERVVSIIVEKEGPEFFLSSYSGSYYYLDNGQVLYY